MVWGRMDAGFGPQAHPTPLAQCCGGGEQPLGVREGFPEEGPVLSWGPVQWSGASAGAVGGSRGAASSSAAELSPRGFGHLPCTVGSQAKAQVLLLQDYKGPCGPCKV